MFKNWKAICEIKDTHFMWAIALINLDTEFGQSIASRLPEYFTNEPQQGPIPLSAIILRSKEEGELYSEEYIVSNGTVGKFGIPVIEFAGDDQAKKDYDLPLLPAEISFDDVNGDDNENMGKKFVWQGKEIVLLEYNENGGLASFAPAELIAVDQ